MFTTPTAIIMSFGAPTELRTRMLRVDGGELDMGKLAQLDALADEVVARTRSRRPRASRGSTRSSPAPPRVRPRRCRRSTHGVTAGAIAVFFGGGAADVAVAARDRPRRSACSRSSLARSTDQARVFELVGAAFAAFAAGIVGVGVAGGRRRRSSPSRR